MTPRELALCAEGYRWRDEREWDAWAYRAAVMLQPWGFKGKPKELLPQREAQSEADFEALAGMTTPGDSLDIMLAKQAARKAKG